MRMTDLKAGWAIVGNDGRRLGTVLSVGQNYILASRAGRPGQAGQGQAGQDQAGQEP